MFVKRFLWVCVLVFWTNCFVVDALKPGSKGVCIVKLSSKRTRSRTYLTTVNKMCGKSKCVVRKTVPEVYTVLKNHTVCCKGWEYSSEQDQCRPLCSLGCLGGTCVLPETCVCDHPKYLDREHKNTCLSPTCRIPCFHADCVAPNTCQCHDGFVAYNGTHCANCQPGYSIDEQLNCQPKCDQPCVNSICTAPNVCTCNTGYRRRNKDRFTCEAYCEELCVNSKCVGSNECECLPGYERQNATFCSPVCTSCDNGECVAPDQCVCNAGYSRIDGKCYPVCMNPCVNGICVAPDTCSCFEGYTSNLSHPHICYKPCNAACKGTCRNGECVGEACKPVKHMTMKVSKYYLGRCGLNRCRKQRYETHREKLPYPLCCEKHKYVQEEDRCQPICSRGCFSGRCLVPDVCVCEPPLVLRNGSTCAPPVCDPPCSHGTCVADNTCRCHDGFHPVNQTKCAPTCDLGYYNHPQTLECTPKCDKPCQNGNCIGRNICSCSEGYTISKDPFKCVPECNPMCSNAECVEPNVCKCLPGYVVDSKYSCRPVCENCEHGDCEAPNICSCHDGYILRKGKCTPTCSSACLNGFCSAPETCTCSSGYRLDITNKFKCIPICDPSCENSACVAPNQCLCHDGYDKTDNSFACTPKCENCEHGVCVKPNECLCHRGYTRENDTCSPICENPCVNGFCSAPNTCSCSKGYKSTSGNYNCIPVCENPCINGNCVSPNTCRCHIGFKLVDASSHECRPLCESCVNGVCVAPDVCMCNEGYTLFKKKCHPVCHNACVNAHCSAPDTCDCSEGYQKNVTSPHICFKPCKGRCLNGFCSIDGTCVCKQGYELNDENCIEMASVACSSCEGSCNDGVCWCINGIPCFITADVETADTFSTKTSLASLEMSWLFAAAITFLLLTVLIIVMIHMWRKRRAYETKKPEGNVYGSVVYTVPDTLLNRNFTLRRREENEQFRSNELFDIDEEDLKMTSERLLDGSDSVTVIESDSGILRA